MLRTASLCGALAAASLFLLAGCNSGDDGYQTIDENPPEVPEAAHHHHEHGPNGGHLIELGDEEYHAELVFDPKSRQTTVYILDGEGKSAAPIEAEEISLHLHVGDDEAELTLTAAPQESDGEGKSSRFEAAGEQLPESVKDEEDFEGHVHVTIGEKQYSGDIEHDHDHGHGEEGHGHDDEHDEHKDGDKE